MDAETRLAELKLRIEGMQMMPSDDLLMIYLNNAEQYILGYTRRGSLPHILEPTVIDIAIVWINRIGIEGETTHSEGGISRTMESTPGYIRDALNRYRLATVPGVEYP